ncbi:MAG: endo-1,4-beta-xylanase [Propionibacteriaceae bacterium]|jgi:GH35 family endo-1,4-beta-xylanase|nr:endo-1,4-beta-xylanase [Propionibacteriaceae bacterium]
MWSITPPETRFPHRQASTVVTVESPNGEPLVDQEIEVRQVSHSFLFGNIGFDFLDYANGTDTTEETARLAQDYLNLYNATTLPFYLGRFEPQRGKPDTARLMATARWFADRGVTVKGHPLVWHTVTPSWLNTLPLPEVEHVLRERIRRDVTEFAGVIDLWDAINEVVIMPVFTAEPNAVTKLAYVKGRIAMVRMAFEEAHEVNPHATFLLNDFDLTTAYECLIEGCLEAGIAIDAIGLQTHMHQGYKGEDQVMERVERFARYGLPLHLTETSLVSGDIMPSHIVDLNDYQIPEWPSTPEGEERQADEMVRHYTSLLGHPSVESIVYWGITDKGAWLGAPIGLIRADGSRKPSYDALEGLIKDAWWVAPTTGKTDSVGQFQLTGWLGDYEIRYGGTTKRLSLTAQSASDTVVV